MKRICQTRFKTVVLGLSLGLIEGLAKVAWPAFPVIEAFGFQSAIIGAYLAAKTTGNIKRDKFEGETNVAEEENR